MYKIIFFDGDGTLWYPKSTKWSKKPFWVYDASDKPKDYLKHLILTPQMMQTLHSLKKRGIILAALSTHPHRRLEADFHMGHKIRHLKLDTIFDHVYTARPYPWGKGKVMQSILKRLKIPKSQALLVGDSYVFDYLSARRVGIECILIQTSYLNIPNGRKVRRKIRNIKMLLNFV
ncbi:hypothetical protein A3B18_02280 [Candidatus Giovannonibacteria bacterium RIFCSPLOWO2_01_FULL_46_13]|uniref:Magnesium-dependent phosphatase-1 n=1 Tax=Candidatus Giovannonibacteria bacterium RIFCSPLOWO2_01_FULL_46_13 TaxID=1798352 RepID=A0A1F5X567_9BACT|nr:MAG: hypothetical protein A3B18_02280 [Candidatus Giovannonibacteria bacterium RIFCSPLOWO2_01_FULL_46_13]